LSDHQICTRDRRPEWGPAEGCVDTSNPSAGKGDCMYCIGHFQVTEPSAHNRLCALKKWCRWPTITCRNLASAGLTRNRQRPYKLTHMTPEERERMNWLVLRIQQEKDHDRFTKLVQELDALIDQKEYRFKDAKKPKNSN